MAFFFGVNKEVLPLKINLAFQEARLKSANNDLHRAQVTLIQKEQELSAVKQLYCGAVKEKQKLTNEAEICRRKMSAASTLINGMFTLLFKFQSAKLAIFTLKFFIHIYYIFIC